MASITIDGLDEEVFRRNIEAMLRVGEADRAAVKLRALIEPFATDSRILPARFLEVSAADFKLLGWEHLGECLARNDLPRNPISALTIAVSDADALGLDAAEVGGTGPLIATSHFTDEAYMFSQCGVSDLLDGYSFYGCEWHGSSTHMDTALTLGGVEDLYEAVARLEAELIASPQPALDKIRAGSLASCYLAVLLFQSVRDTIRAQGLPRPLCVMAGNEGVYPYFDAPVIGSAECAELGLVIGAAAPLKAAAAMDPVEEPAEERELETVGAGEGVFAYGQLGALRARTSAKKPVLELADAELLSAAEMLERASEEQMGDEHGAEGASALDELLAHRGPSQPLFALPPADLPTAAEPDLSLSAPDERLFDAPPGKLVAPEPELAGLDPFTRPASFPEAVEAPFEGEPAAVSAPEDPAEVEPAPARSLPSHSLRARLADAPPPPPPPPPLWKVALSTLSRWLHAIFG